MNRNQILSWVISTSAIVTFIFLVIAAFLHSFTSLNSIGLIGFASIVGGIATFGGIVTGLLGLYSLTSINDKILKAIDDEKEIWKSQVQEQLSAHMRAFSAYSRGITQPDIRLAADNMEIALNLEPELPLASEHIGIRFAEATFQWAWRRIDRSLEYKIRLNTFGALDSEAFIEIGDYRHDAIKWLENVKLIDGDEASHWVKLAKLYALIGDNRKVISTLKLAVKLAERDIVYDMKDLGIFLWNCLSAEEVQEVCQALNYEASITLTEAILSNALERGIHYDGTMRPFLAVRKRGSYMLKSEAPSSPTIYFVGKALSENGEAQYLLNLYSDEVIRFPRKDENPWDINKLLEVVNNWFVTIGEIK